MRGCSVLTRPPSISGKSVSVSTRSTVEAELVLEVRGGAAARDELPAEVGEAAREHVEAGLVVRRDQRAHSSPTTRGSRRCSSVLDARVQRLRRVAREDGDPLLREDRAAVDALVDEVHGRAGFADAGGELFLDGVRAGERRQERGVDVDDRVREAVEEVDRQQVHVAGEHDDAHVVPVRASRPSRRRARRGSP